jgi:hypothetical protein
VGKGLETVWKGARGFRKNKGIEVVFDTLGHRQRPIARSDYHLIGVELFSRHAYHILSHVMILLQGVTFSRYIPQGDIITR